MKTSYVARCVQRNTPETDLQNQVMHIVQWTENGKEFSQRCYSSDPMTAITEVMEAHKKEALLKDFEEMSQYP